jgi:hypothetical protein
MSTQTAPSTAPPTLALADIQGMILRGYSYYYIRHFIFRIGSAPDAVAGVRTFLKALLPGETPGLSVTTAEPWKTPPRCCLNVALTATGLRPLLGDEAYGSMVSDHLDLMQAFDAGAAARAARVGDTGPSAPENWWKNGNWQLPSSPPSTTGLDLVVSLYTLSAADRESIAPGLLALIPACGNGEPALQPAFVQDADPVLGADGKPSSMIHFGYVDGLSQPRIAGAPWESLAAHPTDDSRPVQPWQFVVSRAAKLYRADPFLCNGSFGAFRLLYQDVGAFEAFIASQGAGSAELIAARMCGRWRDGTPLEVSPDKPDPSLTGFELTNFNYRNPTKHQQGPRVTDDLGALCPYAAHTRWANPRDDNLVQGNNNLAYPEAEQRRIRRFATPFGPPYTPESAGAQRGLVGWFIGASLVQQFEFLVGTWITAPGGGFRTVDASPNLSGVDPLFGPQADDPVATDFDFDYLAGAGYDTVPGLTRFIRTDGACTRSSPASPPSGSFPRRRPHRRRRRCRRCPSPRSGRRSIPAAIGSAHSGPRHPARMAGPSCVLTHRYGNGISRRAAEPQRKGAAVHRLPRRGRDRNSLAERNVRRRGFTSHLARVDACSLVPVPVEPLFPTAA